MTDTNDTPPPTNPIQPISLHEEMENSFLDYAMSVIMSRALPDVRDGLKPVHRRIIWDMDEQGFRPDRAHVKCARVTGDTMAKYHPHGDSAIYDALVRMAQPFSLRHPLIDFHGNYGSPDFGPAASRYTECRLNPLAMQLLADIDEDTVDMIPNYDGSTSSSPWCSPPGSRTCWSTAARASRSGMATNIPPHNLGEVIDAAVHLLDNPEATPDELMAVRQGPGLPDRRPDPGPGRHHRRLPHRPWQREDAGDGLDRGIQDRAHARSSSPSCRTRPAARRSPAASRSSSTRETSRASPTSTTPRRVARPTSSSRSSATPTPNVVLNNLYKLTQLQTTLRDQHGRARRRGAAHAQPRRRCWWPTSSTRSRSSPGGRSSGWRRPAT